MSEELRPCPFCGAMPMGEDDRYMCSTLGCVMQEDTISAKDWNTRPIEDALNKRIAELEAGAISAGKQEVETKNRLLKERDKKIANLHKVIAKQQLKIQRQAENITTLLHLYTSGKRSKSHKKLREKYRALKARIAELEGKNERFTVHSDIERQDDKSPNDTQTQTIVYGKEREE